MGGHPLRSPGGLRGQEPEALHAHGVQRDGGHGLRRERQRHQLDVPRRAAEGDRVYIGNRVVHALFAKVRWHNRVLGTSAALRRRHAERFANLLNSYLGLMRHFRTCNIRRRAAEEVLAVWADCISFSPDYAKAAAAPRCRRLDRARRRAGKEHREDLLFLKTNML